METYSIIGERKEELMKIAQVLGITITEIQELTPDLSDIIILTYEPFQELLAKSNETFRGTAAEIPSGNGEVKNAYFLKRAAIITASHELQYPYKPITPLQSEQLLQQNQFPKDPPQYWEDLTLILYSLQGTNRQEANYLFQQLQSHNLPTELPLLIVNPGLEKDEQFPHKVKPIIIPGLTQAYPHETLKQIGEHNFEYGLEHGLPSINDLGKGNRTLYMPSRSNDLGLRVLYRNWGFGLYAGGGDLVNSSEGGRVTLARTIF